MEFFRNFASSIIILIAIPLLVVTTLSFVANRTVFSEEYVKEQAAEHNIYAGIVDVAQNAPREEGEEGDIGAVVAEHLTPERARAAFEPAMTSLYRWMRGEKELQITLDLRELKAEIEPTLSADERTALEEEYPDDLTLADSSRVDERGGGLALLKGIYGRAQQLQRYAPYIVLGLLVLLAAINHGRSRLRRPAYVFLVGGLMVALVGGLGLMGTQLLLSRVSEDSNLPAVLQESVRGLAETMGGDITRLILFSGVAYLVLAILLFAISFFIHAPVPIATGPDERAYDPKRGTSKK